MTAACLSAAPLALAPQAAHAETAAPATPASGHATGAAPAAGQENVVDEHAVHFPPFDVTTFPSQLLWLAITFGLLYLLMSRVTLPRIGRILEERHDRIADDLEEANKHKAESEAAQAAYEKALHEARSKANAIASETRARLAADSDANRKSLEADLNAKLSTAEQRIATTKTEAMSHVRGIAVDTAGTIVSTLVGAAAPKADVEKAVDAALASRDAA
ncbi:F0F1 ATP synthase subunit B [Xanthobacter sediminis]|uniref:F0F1 ATP synthase subunit B n=1 Tax=Xanthobacter sediminis TaxID=3119926 RepID=UPI00372641BC